MTRIAEFPETKLMAENPADWRRLAGCRCSRCGGLMVAEEQADLFAQRCVQCGELVDPVILLNRQRHPAGGRVRHAIPGVAMRAITLFLFLSWAGTPAPAIAAGQDRETETKDPYSGRQGQNVAAGLRGTDWRAVTVELDPGAAQSWQSRPDGELLYVLEGSGRLETGGKSPITLNPGLVAKLSSTPRHVVKNTSGSRMLKVLVVFSMDQGQAHPLLAARRAKEARQNSMPAPRAESGQRETGKLDDRKQIGGSEEMGLVF